MENLKEDLAKIAEVAKVINDRKDELIEEDLKSGSTLQSSAAITMGIIEGLKNFKESIDYVGKRKSICNTKEEEVAIVMPYSLTTAASGPIASQVILGNNVRIRPSSQCVGSYKILEEIWKRFYPEQVRFDYSRATEFMKNAIENPNVKVICLFGHDSMGMGYKEAVKQAGKKFLMEGPGKNPAIVLEDADVKTATQELLNMRFGLNAGQMCISPGRFYVHESLFDQFIETIIELTKNIVIGDPQDPKTTIGPIGSEAAVKYIEEQFNDARAKGGQVAYGGKIEGSLIYPTIWVNVDHSMLGMQDESFGPIMWFMPFKTTEEVISLSRDNKYGLGANIFGVKDTEKVKNALIGKEYLHEVDDFVFGKYGMVMVYPGGADVLRGLGGFWGGYGYSGWVWETVDGEFKLKQGVKALALETSIKME